MATIVKAPIEVFNPQTGGDVFREMPEDSLRVYKRGAVLIVAAGFLQEGGADPDNIAGIAQNDGQNGAVAGDKRTLVARALPNVSFVGNIGGAAALAAAQLGVKYGLAKEGDNWHVDTAETVNVAVIVEDFIDAIGDVNGRVKFKFLDSRTLWE